MNNKVLTSIRLTGQHGPAPHPCGLTVPVYGVPKGDVGGITALGTDRAHGVGGLTASDVTVLWDRDLWTAYSCMKKCTVLVLKVYSASYMYDKNFHDASYLFWRLTSTMLFHRTMYVFIITFIWNLRLTSIFE